MRTSQKNFFRIILHCLLITATTGVIAQESNPSNTQEELKLQLQIRPRAEFRNGVFTPILDGQEPAAFVSQRNRLGLVYSKGQKLSVGLTMQMLNVWGNDPQIQQTANNVSLFEAWAQIALSKTAQIKIGRQVFSYDDERILGSLDWNNAARKHDAILGMFEQGTLIAHVALAFNQNSEKVNSTFYNDSLSQPYKNLQFVWLQYKANERLKFTALMMNQARQRNSDSLYTYLQTFGANAYYHTSRFNATGSMYYQTGKSNMKNAVAISTAAWMTSVYGNYAINKKFSIGAGSDYLSGMDMGSTSSKLTAFNPLYGTHHKFYGYMDYFYVASGHKNTGLWDSYLNASIKVGKKTGIQAAFHHFVSPVKVLNYQHETASSNLGDEIDLSFNYNLDKAVKIIGGYGHMLPTTSMKYIKNIAANQQMKSTQNWVWLSVVVTPEIKLLNKVAKDN